MLRKTLSILLVSLLMNSALVPFAYGNIAEKEAEFAKMLKAEITKQGVGEKSKIKLKL